MKTGVYKGVLYINGVVNSGYRLYKGNLYKDKVFNKGYALFEEQLYLDEKLNIGYALHKNQLYNDDAMNSGYAEFKNQLYLDEQLNEEIMLFEDRLFNGASLNKGYLLFEDQLYNGSTLNEGLTLFAVDGQDFYYNDGDLAEGLFEAEGKEEAFEKGIKQPAKVLDIEVANSKQVKVTFNKSIDEKTLTQETLKVVEAKNAVKPIVLNYKLSTDKQVATITFSNVLAGETKVQVTFNEAVKAPIGTVYKVKIGQDVIMNVDAVVTAYNSSSHTVTFTINKELKVADFAKKISIIADSQSITDEAGNAVEEGQGIEINGTGL